MTTVFRRGRHWDRRSGIVRWLFVLAGIGLHGVAVPVVAQSPESAVAKGRRWAVILVGLPGDEAHAELFRGTADTWQTWLTDTLDVPTEQVLRWPDQPTQQLTADAIRSGFAELSRKLKPDDCLWVFTLGHGNYDGKQSWFHVAGKDPSAEDFGRWLSDVRCREQVIWATQQNSGWFVKPLSRPGRIVIAATAADDESNETEFPHALATMMQSPIAKLDLDHDDKVSVAELFTAASRETLHRFQQDKRLPTEHPQLDDNGDGVGTEELFPKPSDDPAAKPNPNAKIDGALAKKTFLPWTSKKE